VIGPHALDREQVAAFEAEGLGRCANDARAFGLLAITLLVASAAVSFAVNDPWAVHLLVIRLLAVAAIGAALWYLGSDRRHPRRAGLAMILMLGATIEALAAYTGGATSVQHDRLILVILGAAVLITWPARWVALAAAGVTAEFLSSALATGGFSSPVFLPDIGSLLICSAVAVTIGVVRERRRLDAFAAHMAREVAARRLAEQEAR
jgi:hypothetical protein